MRASAPKFRHFVCVIACMCSYGNGLKKVLIIFYVCCNMRDKSFRFINSLHSLICNDEHLGMPSLSLSHTHRHIHPTPTHRNISHPYIRTHALKHTRVRAKNDKASPVSICRGIFKKNGNPDCRFSRIITSWSKFTNSRV